MGIKFVDTSNTQSDQVAQSAELPDIVYDNAEKSFIWNAGALQRYSGHKARIIGEYRTLDISRTDATFLLISAKSSGWIGGDNLFTKVRDGILGLKLKSDRVVIRADAADLAKVLAQMCQRLAEADPNAESSPLVKDARQLARLASEGGFEIQVLPPPLPKL